MRQVVALLWDSYRMLRARILFWVVLAISLLVALVFASIGINEQGYSMLFGLWEVESELINSSSGYAELFYLVVFTNVIVKWWLGWLAITLALISCCSIFPEFLSAGSVDVAVSKPIGRIQLFLVKYLGSLLFVLLQVGLFCLVVFVALGLRLEQWNWSIFWAVPLLVFVFSLIYCVGVLVSVWTRSTLLSLLAMAVLWGTTLLVQWSESTLYSLSYSTEQAGEKINFETGEVEDVDEGAGLEGLKKAHSVVKTVGWVLPKTREVTLMINQKIRTGSSDQSVAGMSLFAFVDQAMMSEFQGEVNQDAANRHSLFYVLGSSALFELVILSLACFLFVRKDY